MFLDECKFLLLNYPDVYATLENTILFCQFDPEKFARVLGELLLYGGPDKLIYSSAATVVHPRHLLEDFAEFQMPEDFQVPLTDEVRAKILAENFARLHDIDIEEKKRKIADDEFARKRNGSGLHEPWSTVRGQAVTA